jgi:preprotein translocase subunit SecD
MTFLEERTIGPELGPTASPPGKSRPWSDGGGVVYMVASYGCSGLCQYRAGINMALIFAALSAIGAR